MRPTATQRRAVAAGVGVESAPRNPRLGVLQRRHWTPLAGKGVWRQRPQPLAPKSRTPRTLLQL